MQRVVFALALMTAGRFAAVGGEKPPEPTTELLYRMELNEDAGGQVDGGKLLAVVRKRATMAGFLEAEARVDRDAHLIVRTPLVHGERLKLLKRVIENPGRLEFRLVADDSSEAAGQWRKTGKAPEGYTEYPLRLGASAGVPPRNVLVVDRCEMTDESIAAARSTWPRRHGKPEVSMSLTPAGAKRFAELTGKNVRRRLAMVLNTRRDADGDIIDDGEKQAFDGLTPSKGICLSAPAVQGPIHGGQAIISGPFSFVDAQELAIVLGAGRLPCRLVLEKETPQGIK